MEEKRRIIKKERRKERDQGKRGVFFSLEKMAESKKNEDAVWDWLVDHSSFSFDGVSPLASLLFFFF